MSGYESKKAAVQRSRRQRTAQLSGELRIRARNHRIAVWGGIVSCVKQIIGTKKLPELFLALRVSMALHIGLRLLGDCAVTEGDVRVPT